MFAQMRQHIRQRGGAESNERDVEDAIPYGWCVCLASSGVLSVCGRLGWCREDVFALGASPRGLAALVERGGRLLFIRRKE